MLGGIVSCLACFSHSSLKTIWGENFMVWNIQKCIKQMKVGNFFWSWKTIWVIFFFWKQKLLKIAWAAHKLRLGWGSCHGQHHRVTSGVAPCSSKVRLKTKRNIIELIFLLKKAVAETRRWAGGLVGNATWFSGRSMKICKRNCEIDHWLLHPPRLSLWTLDKRKLSNFLLSFIRRRRRMRWRNLWISSDSVWTNESTWKWGTTENWEEGCT